MGKLTGEGWILKESFRIYGRALTELTKALQVPKRAEKGSLLAAARLLSIFELFVGSSEQSSVIQSQNWERHVNGELALLRARGPESYIRGDAHSVFTDGRLQYQYMLSAKQRRKLFISDPEWATVPWMETPKTCKDLLLDILLEVPGLLEDYDRMSSCPDAAAKIDQRDALIAKCWVLDGQMQQWEASLPDPIGLHDIPTFSPDSPTISHKQLSLVEMKALYWSGCLLLYSTLNLALCLHQDGTSASLPERADHNIYIRNIAGAVQFLLDPQAGLLGQHVAVWPLAMALQFCMTLPAKPMDLQPKEIAILVQTLQGSQGEGIKKFILSMNADSHRHPAWMSEMCGTAGIRARAKMWVGV
ncbi:uncharacterized protein DNG_04437 [Cephalotrichum gorgonifer]|uniref:Uncharacterized protein n=1 Tax=Cephalotrichum gorgonifer TaxID=2041049 RepID=A0AAE8MY24_9PEZI|nr:uncharacterized protein DNG_04437 [Cephalotrichum gorgonifer]